MNKIYNLLFVKIIALLSAIIFNGVALMAQHVAYNDTVYVGDVAEQKISILANDLISDGIDITHINVLDGPFASTYEIDITNNEIRYIVPTDFHNSIIVDSFAYTIVPPQGLANSSSEQAAYRQATNVAWVYVYSGIYFGDCDVCVWPGDTDGNGLVDAYDILPIGWGYGSEGIAREYVDISWDAHSCDDWASDYMDLINYKHLDCNGDGIVGYDDVMAINANYNMTHDIPLVAPLPTSDAVFTVNVVNESIPEAGDTVVIELIVGDGTESSPDYEVHGIANKLITNYIISDTTEVQISYPSSFFNDGESDLIDVQYIQNVDTLALDLGVSRTSGTPAVGSGVYAVVSFVMEDVIIGAGGDSGKNEEVAALRVEAQHVVIANSEGIAAVGSSNIASDAITYRNANEPNVSDAPAFFEVAVNPNPAQNMVQISTNQQANIQSIALWTINGQLMLQQTYNAYTFSGNDTYNAPSTLSLDLSPYPNGMYLLQVASSEGTCTQRLQVMR